MQLFSPNSAEDMFPESKSLLTVINWPYFLMGSLKVFFPAFDINVGSISYINLITTLLTFLAAENLNDYLHILKEK